jgi:tRNA pseudouridine38-40 synthase
MLRALYEGKGKVTAAMPKASDYCPVSAYPSTGAGRGIFVGSGRLPSETMMRVALGVQYDGAGFRGWQAQPTGVRTVQSTLEQALSKVADHPIKLVCAGRTDAGVHGVAQVAHFDTHAARSARSWVRGGNAHLPPDVSLNWACEAPDDFHARFSALTRRYRYLILNQPQRSALWRQRATWYYRPLDAVECTRPDRR